MFLVPFTRNASEFSRGLERLFDEPFERWLAPALSAEGEGARRPALDLTESDRAYTVKLDLPGVAKEDVKVSVEGSRVTVQAETRKDQEKKEGDRVVYRERSVSSFARSFTLPGEVDSAEAGARLADGVLTLTLPKRAGKSGSQIAVS
ncbi:MAG: Hsp20/alpha crystallin family protein [Rubrivivax sp.]|nr:Hsp20/alpha crystallin family protein [Rubrivivax sp.]